jgi:hypothetical protein
MAFDQNKRIFGFYTQTGEYDINDNTTKENRQSLALSWILVIILSIILIGLGIAFYKLLPYENTLEKTLDNLIMAANQLGEYEIQLKLTEYVAEKYPRTVEETIKKKFRL